ncbi:MAG: MYG1 family protein [Candidatus Pacebacteria bacterium]|nr:MYG1 family protein [Candidatus Paceibacterota bacterium]
MFKFLQRKKTIVVHNGSFHADDIFACAVLGLYLEKQGLGYKIIRTRDEVIINKADYVVDVGGIDNPEDNRFDHHQPGGAGKRDNGIPYASFGLVWKKFGPLLVNDNDIFTDIDRRIAQPIDAIDNGISISEPTESGLCDYGIYGIIGAYQNTWKEAGNTKCQLEKFISLVHFFKNILKREIERSGHRLEMLTMIQDIYDTAEDKTILEIPYHVTVGSLIRVLDKHKEVMFIVCKSNTNWKALAMRKEACSFENRKSLPTSWGGKRGKELAQETGVEDALFCHNALWMAVAASKEGAHKLAKLALDAE